MKKLSLIILYLLNENNAVSPLGALSVKQILTLLDDGLGSTYYISESGNVFLQGAN